VLETLKQSFGEASGAVAGTDLHSMGARGGSVAGTDLRTVQLNSGAVAGTDLRNVIVSSSAGSGVDLRAMQAGGFGAVALQAHPEIEKLDHVHHAGNSSGIVDGAAAVLIGNEASGKAAGLKPRARIRAFANIGSEPALMLTGPVDVTRKLLKRAGMAITDIDLFEVNEAFAAVVLRYLQAFDLDAAKVNVNGGAIALGHPLGATGAMILGTLIDELHRRNLRYGMATLCVGGGMGIATIVERI
jgi:acetyl-CoA C-acetyltransferase